MERKHIAEEIHFSLKELFELADEHLSEFYDNNGIECLYDIDDAEY